MQTRCSILPSIADKTKHEVEKGLVWKQCVFTARWHYRCNRLAEVWPWPPRSSSFTEAITIITARELSDTRTSQKETKAWKEGLYYTLRIYMFWDKLKQSHLLAWNLKTQIPNCLNIPVKYKHGQRRLTNFHSYQSNVSLVSKNVNDVLSWGCSFWVRAF
jgi:hypothetical protein